MTSKLTYFMLLSVFFTAYSYASFLQVEGKNQAHYKVSLGSLKKNTPYLVSCRLEAHDKNTVQMEPHFLPGIGYQALVLNGAPFTDNEATLSVGENLLSFGLIMENDEQSSYNRFDLSAKYQQPFTIKSCTITSLPHLDKRASNYQTGTEELTTKSSFFVAYNETDNEVTLGVGNFLPNLFLYRISAHSWATIFVSSDNQNIHIKKVER